MPQIIVLGDAYDWSSMGAEIWTITDDALKRLEEGHYPKHLIEGDDVIEKVEIVAPE